MPTNDVAIYSPLSVGLYDAQRMRAGGAERQMGLIARALVEQGYRVAHVVYRPRSPLPPPPGLSLVVRAPHAGGRSLAPVREAVAIWRALAEADASVVVVRTGTPVVGLAALYCRLRRRRLVFSSANDADFTFETLSDRWYRAPIYRFGLRLANLVVVQTRDQEAVARRVLGRRTPIVQISSFVEATDEAGAPDVPAEWFLWIGRAVEYKEPFRFLDLARELPDARFLMIAARDRPKGDELRPALADAAAELPNVEFLDPMPHAQLAELIRGSVAIVNTSRLEGMPNVFLEAWSQGKPVLTLRVDPDGVVAREELGVSAGGSWQTFVKGARRLWDERTISTTTGERARKYVATEHGFDRVGRAWAAALWPDAHRRP